MNDTHDLDWLAFRYIAGELTDDETAAFELQLADDQLARDAVAHAVELSQTVLAAESLAPAAVMPAAAQSPAWRVAWFAIGAAACLLLVLSTQLGRDGPPTSEVSDQVANAWGSQFESYEPVELPNEALESEEFDVDTADDVPGWMVEAVRSLHSDDAPSDDDTDEIMES